MKGEPRERVALKQREADLHSPPTRDPRHLNGPSGQSRDAPRGEVSSLEEQTSVFPWNVCSVGMGTLLPLPSNGAGTQ